MSLVKKTKRGKKFFTFRLLKKLFFWGVLFFFILGGSIMIWASSLNLPDLNSFEERKVSQSTKIYDRTGEVVLYDVFGEFKRTVIPLAEMSKYIQYATISVEDQNFYSHNGIEISSILRAIVNNIKQGNLLGGQGGSTITQQIIKNTFLTREKKVSRKLKEWVLAPRLEKVLNKNQILEIYLNEIPYGGSVYGIQEAARRFFSKDAKDLDLAESAYLAAMPQAPTFYSPYGNNLESLKNRKNHVLSQMFNSGYITAKERDEAKDKDVVFEKQEQFGIKAPHFVLYVKELLEKEYGQEILEQGGLKVITTLDWELQEAAEEIVKRKALENSKTFGAENASLIATDPKTGEILVMVGSRDYFDEVIDGNFNIATADRQPGSTFKPIVYAEAFNKGYRPDTVVFDLPTEFSTACSVGGSCYSPVNYDGVFRGPVNFRESLAQSINVPAVKALYLAGLRDSLLLAKKMGLETLGDEKLYGLTLVLGGGEVRPIDLTQAYGVFAADGIKNILNPILEIKDNVGETLYKATARSSRVLSEQTARLINDVLSDNVARTPSFGSNSPLYFPNKDVAAKTGTTNDYKDAWTIGYTPNIVVTAWAGNNNNKPMEKKVAGFIITPLWNEFMEIALNKMQHDSFIKPEPLTPYVKPIIAGYWMGEETDVFDIFTGELAEDDTPKENLTSAVVGGTPQIHSILYWVDRNSPLGPKPHNPNNDYQYYEWEKSVRNWKNTQDISDTIEVADIGSIVATKLHLLSPVDGRKYNMDDILNIKPKLNNKNILSGEVFVNDEKIGDLGSFNKEMSFFPKEIPGFLEGKNTIKVLVVGDDMEIYESEVVVNIEN